jgi:molecular chaperone HscB
VAAWNWSSTGFIARPDETGGRPVQDFAVEVFRVHPDSQTGSSFIVPGDATTACWSCGTMRAVHFCSACGKVQPPSPVDYFTFFGLPRRLNLDTVSLEREFYQLSRRLHPDLYARADPQEQEWSEEQSSQLNDAYRTLKDPIRRTEYLLRLEGVELEEQSKAATDKAREAGEVKEQVVPPDWLEEVFELNLELDELRMNKQGGEADAQLTEELQGRKAAFEKKLADLFRELTECWIEWDRLVDAGREADGAGLRDKMVDLVNRRNYVRNLVRDVNEALEV